MQIFQPLKSFKHAFVSSISDLNYYVEILNTKGKFTLKFILFFYFLLGIVLTGLFSIREVPELDNIINTSREQVIANYPEGVYFDYQNGQLTSNAQMPFVIPIPESLRMDDSPKNLMIIDTAQDHLPENQNTLFYLTSTKVFINSMQGDWSEKTIAETISSEEFNSFHIDRAGVLNLAEASKSRQQFLLSILPIGAFFVFSIGLLVVRMISMLINALIVQLFFQLLNKPLTYRKVLQLCLHVLVPAELVAQITALLFPNLEFPMFGLAFWLIITVVLWHMRHLQVLKISIDKDKMDKEAKKE